jgi:hypothetical protein
LRYVYHTIKYFIQFFIPFNYSILNFTMGSIEIQTPLSDIPSSDRVEPGSFPLRLANLPESSLPKSIDPKAIASEYISRFNKTIRSADASSLKTLFCQESYWRDHLCLTWDFHTLHGPDKIHDLICKTNGSRLHSLSLDTSSELRSPKATAVGDDGKTNIVQAFLDVETDVGRGKGVVRLVYDGEWKCFTLYTVLEELKGHEESIGKRRPYGVVHGERTDKRNWADRRKEEMEMEDGVEPAVLILGMFLRKYSTGILGS